MSYKHFIFGETICSSAPISKVEIQNICKRANEKRKIIAEYPLHRTYSLLTRVQELWENPNYPRRIKLQGLLPEELRFSPEMVQLGLERVAGLFNAEVLDLKVQRELQGIPRQHGYKYLRSTQTALRWYPLGVLFHVLAGNGFLGAASSLLEGLLTSNINILKMAQGKTSFLIELLESIKECDIDGVISNSICALTLSSNQKDVLDFLKIQSDGVIVWGGEAAVKGIRENLPARTRIIVFGPKMSFSLISKKGIEDGSLDEAAQKLADEVSLWDQSACTAPQVCYVQSEDMAKEFLEALSIKLEDKSKELPAGPTSSNTAVEIQKWRGRALVEEALRESLIRESKSDLSWTVFLSNEKELIPSPLHRTIRIVPFDEIKEIANQLEPLRGYIQTVGIYCHPKEASTFCDHLAKAGAQRFVQLGNMSYGEVDDPHDGAYDLPQLMQLIFKRVRLPNQEASLNDYITEKEIEKLVNFRLDALGEARKDFPALNDSLKGAPLQNLDDLSKLSVMNKVDAVQLSEKATLNGGYVSRSGGSTGEPSFSIYSSDEWDQMMQRSIEILRACGLNSTDRIANCLSAGDLYGGFVSFDHINSKIGATSFAFGATSNKESLVHAWKKFKFNVIQAMPSHIIPILKSIKESEPSFVLEKFIYGGTPLSEEDRDWLTKKLEVKRISAIYGANDGGPIGFQCTHLFGNKYHLVDDFNYIEIVNSNGKRMETGHVGRILLTSLLKFNSPLIRYEVGDLGLINPTPCPCLRTNRILELKGRIQDHFEVNGNPYSISELMKTLRPTKFSQMQVELYNDKVTITLEGENIDTQNLDEILPEIGSLKTEFKIVGSGQIPRKPNSTKINFFIDRRST